jgi:hypothetical protein
MSKDETVLPALQRAAKFHVVMTYPNGTPVETVDERNSYENTVVVPNVGFTFSPEGRGYLKKQIELRCAAAARPTSASTWRRPSCSTAARASWCHLRSG